MEDLLDHLHQVFSAALALATHETNWTMTDANSDNPDIDVAADVDMDADSVLTEPLSDWMYQATTVPPSERPVKDVEATKTSSDFEVRVEATKMNKA